MTKTRISVSILLAAIVAAVVVAVVGAGPAEAAFPGQNGKIAFGRGLSVSAEIYVMDSDGSNKTPLTTNSEPESAPAFSPDGTKIAFRRDFTGDADRIATIRADGTGQADLTAPSRVGDNSPDWQPLSFELSLRVSDGPDPVRVGQDLTYSLAVHNAGPSIATNVLLTDRLPSGVGFVSASQGCTNTSGTVRCSLGDVAPGTTTTVEVVVQPTAEGTLSNTASISSVPRDPSPENNSDTEATTVSPANGAPTANNDSYSASQDKALRVAAPGLLANDTDTNGDALTAVEVTDPPHGEVFVRADGSFAYFPDAGYVGADPFTYTVSDGKGGTDTATVNITVKDTVKPRVLSVTPRENLTGVAPGTNLTATFDERMKATTITGSFQLFKVNPDRTTTRITNVAVTLTTNGLKATLDPFGPNSTTKLAKNTKYKAVVTTGARDLAGNPLAANKVWYFTVMP